MKNVVFASVARTLPVFLDRTNDNQNRSTDFK
jgi:hypothetical protein